MTHIIGLLPCSGKQTRMQELVFSKELLPLFDSRPVIQHSIDALRRVTPNLRASVYPKKKDLIRYLKNQGVTVIPEPTPYGLPTSIAMAASNTNAAAYIFALPDTYYEPEDCFSHLINHGSSNVLGLFASGTPERFDSVQLAGDLIKKYAVKVDPPLSSWTMGCGKLSAEGIRYLAAQPSNHSELIFGNLIQPLIKKKQLFGLTFPQSHYFDLGTPTSYIEYLIHRYPPSPPQTKPSSVLLDHKPLNLDIGAGGMVTQGFISVDRFTQADIKDDITSLSSFTDKSVDQVNTTHVLEHLPNDQIKPAMRSVYRILKPGGMWTIEVPDFPWVLQDFLNTPEPKRWGWKLQTVFGLQSHPGEFHQTGFSQERLGRLLVNAGFTHVKTSIHFSKRHSQQVIRATALKPVRDH